MRKLFLALCLAAFAATARADEVVIKLATLAPQGSTWHNLLKELAERWSQISGGRVKLKIYAGGTQGSEGDMVRKMSVGQLQAASISAIGMHDVVREPQALSVPGMIDSQAEFQAVFPKVEPRLDQLLEQHGYVALQWAQIGFIHFFCTKPYRTPAEMTDAKMFAWDGDPASVEAWKAAGFHPVVLSSTDMVPSLQTGMINCIANVPQYVLAARLHDKANHMIDVNWGYLIGATLVRKDAWNRIPADLRPKLMAAARELGLQVDAEVRKQNDQAVVAMARQGLQVIRPDPAPWRADAEKAWPVIRGRVIPAPFFDEVKRARDQYRAAHR